MIENTATLEEVLEAKGYVVKYLVNKHKYRKEEAMLSVDKSRFARLLKEDPDHALYYTAQDWADEIVETELKAKANMATVRYFPFNPKEEEKQKFQNNHAFSVLSN